MLERASFNHVDHSANDARCVLDAFAHAEMDFSGPMIATRHPSDRRGTAQLPGRCRLRKRFTTEQIIGLLREAEVRLSQGRAIGTVCRSIGVSQQSYYRWRREYGGLKLDQAKRFKDLERENEQLKMAVSEPTFDKLILEEARKGKYYARP